VRGKVRSDAEKELGTGKTDRDEWIVKCPKCGRIRESCRHVSREDVRRIVRLLDAGVEVYQAEEDRESSEPHIHEPVRPVAQLVKPRYTMDDLVVAESTKEGLLEAVAVLLFDEADAVFQRRGVMATPWMNRDVNVLLSQMENYAGVVILATNLARVMDRALDRRIDIAVEFPLPDAALRRKIFERLVPSEAPLAKID